MPGIHPFQEFSTDAEAHTPEIKQAGWQEFLFSPLFVVPVFRLQFDFPAADISMTKYVFVTGGVVSSLGKGIAAASLGAILESRGIKITHLKLDP